MATAEPITNAFRFHLEYVDESGRVLADTGLRPPDFAHAIRHTLFDAFRRGLSQRYQPLAKGARLEPIFPATGSTSPRAQGFYVAIPVADGSEHRCEFDISYFQSSANRLRARLLRTSELTEGQDLFYRLQAFLDEEPPVQREEKLPISFTPANDGIVVRAGSRAACGPAELWDYPLESEVAVLLDRGVLEEVVEEARAEPEHEIGGFLLGHVLQDPTNQEVFVVITGLASARDTSEASETSVTFTPASFAHARSIASLRAAEETICGWYHSHPFRFCAECPLPTPTECISKVLFFSQDDVHMMESTFEQPYMVGLLAAVEPRIEQSVGHLPVRLYGWRGGTVQQRGMEVITATAHASALAGATRDLKRSLQS